ncbi:MAG TPA: TVP38/TMEM64 family protein [Candidatus Merdivicinus intestinavium]|nr:TVP38/TMEM64 family protein [Candidatus Merdivicinus intestinavium]
MEEKHKSNVRRAVTVCAWFIAAVMVLFLGGFIWYHWDSLYAIFQSENAAAMLQEFIGGFGVWGALILILFQVGQIAIAFLPGEPIELASGMMYGGILGALLCLIGVLIGTYLVFFVVQKLGSGVIAAFHDESKVKKINKLSVFRYSRNAELMTFILFLIPGLPKDFFTFIAPLTPISIHRFVLISTLGRAPGMLITTYAGVSLLEGNYLLAVALYGVLGLCALIGVIFYRRMVKEEKAAEEKK